MSTCPSFRYRCVPLYFVPQDKCVSHCLSHSTVLWHHGTFHGMSTYLSYICICSTVSPHSKATWDHRIFHRIYPPVPVQMHVCPTVPSHSPPSLSPSLPLSLPHSLPSFPPIILKLITTVTNNKQSQCHLYLKYYGTSTVTYKVN